MKEIEIPEGCEAKIVGNKVVFVPKESEEERIRKNICRIVKEHMRHCAEAGMATGNHREALAYLEKQKEYIEDIRQYAYNKGLVDAEEKQKPAESDAIKGGDFISDGKRVFLVLANVKERNLGETVSTFCESRILGVDGVVYCNGDDFKKFTRATSDERAKFIHDLKVGIKLKEHPAEWSEDIRNWKNIAYYVLKEWLGIGQYLDNPALDKIAKELQERYGSVSHIGTSKWSDEDEQFLLVCKNALQKYQSSDKWDAAIIYNWLEKRLKSLRLQPKAEWSKEDEGLIDLAVAAAEDFYDKKNPIRVEIINFLKSLRPQPHWKPSEEQIKAIDLAIRFVTDDFDEHPTLSETLRGLYDDLKKL